jgi:ribosomal protein L11 methyltransferase
LRTDDGGRVAVPGGAVIVLAAAEDEVPAAAARFGELGLSVDQILAPSENRRLLLVPVDDQSSGGPIVAGLRAEGRLAVLRPAGGVHLEAWIRHTLPIAVGENITLCFAWSEHDRQGLPNTLELDPGGGFGTGRHPTTQLLLQQLAARIAGGERVLDVGCGSGVLGLGALRLGAGSVVAADIDQVAVEAARRNAALNGLEGHLEATAAPLDEIAGTFDVIVANIGWAALVDLAPQLTGHLAPSGWLAVSGISPAHCSLVTASLRPLEVVEQRRCDEWSSLVLARTEDSTCFSLARPAAR